ncbi:hypothetical protein [Streptomyces anandii]|uniref:Uncharacterized protein n=1 Tax=Streptomyces anandii TaxID=285454 RepID=A0ABW6GZD6_9ACTN|nr:hypothetical protein [Streptomyces anandii]GGX71187.1 hypothetical protein GCM10010510_14410 [Streptomyces anandii JCM 4720]
MDESPVRESYSFVCLSCGFAWERTFEIRHALDSGGVRRATYFVAGVREPSPLSHGVCRECGGHHIRILRAGRVASARPGAQTGQ